MSDFLNPNLNLKFVAGKFVDADKEYISVPKIVVDIADYLTQLVPFVSPNGIVETEEDWKIVVKLFEAFVRCYSTEYTAYLETSKRLKYANIAEKGKVKGTDLQHQMEIPEKFDQLLKLFYPLQTYDTKFARRLAKEIPLFKAV